MGHGNKECQAPCACELDCTEFLNFTWMLHDLIFVETRFGKFCCCDHCLIWAHFIKQLVGEEEFRPRVELSVELRPTCDCRRRKSWGPYAAPHRKGTTPPHFLLPRVVTADVKLWTRPVIHPIKVSKMWLHWSDGSCHVVFIGICMKVGRLLLVHVTCPYVVGRILYVALIFLSFLDNNLEILTKNIITII